MPTWERNKNKNFIISILTGAFFVFTVQANCQSDSLKLVSPGSSDSSSLPTITDDSTSASEQAKPLHKKSPRVAWISSAILPGLGQAYNGKYWKIPIIYGGAAGIYYAYDWNNSRYLRCKTALKQLDQGDIVTDPDLMNFDKTSIENYRDSYRRSRGYTVIFMGLLYAANMVDAMVDAYMFDYDISRDLTLHVDPTLIPSDPYSYTPTCGLKLSLRF